MATLHIDILNPVIDLINDNNRTYNSCKTVFFFNILSIPNSTIIYNAFGVYGGVYAWDKIYIDNGAGWQAATQTGSFSMNSTGKARYKIEVGNAITDCNTVRVTINDTTNQKSEFVTFVRCDKMERCDTPPVTTPPNPTPDPDPPTTPEITSDTYVNIWYDTSGSMNHVKPKLEEMVANGGALYQRIRPYYNSDAEYFSRMRFLPWADETTLLALSDYLRPDDKTINLIFQNEAGAVYYWDSDDSWTINSPRENKFNQDMLSLRSRLQNYNADNYHGIVMQIQEIGTADPDQLAFKALLEALRDGTGVYTGLYNLTDKPYISYKFGVDANGTSTYFANQVVEALNELGFNIP